MSLLVKICGLKTEESVTAAVEAGADMLGFVFHPKSPRFVTPERAGELAPLARGRAKIVALVVDADDAQLAKIKATTGPDMWQFHGQESIERISEVRSRFGLSVMKAFGWSESGEAYDDILGYEHHVDMLLIDAKPPKDAAYPGGHGRTFDWTTLVALAPSREQVGGCVEYMLSGGLTPENVSQAITTLRAMRAGLIGVDVSSGVESAPGVKDLGKIRAFIAAVREAEAA
ncbi:phosphoribosylanthranilate isomerase [Rhabdaerophilum sp.]|uniref:phosphoribosylanthranilate isomerase n=1 Tax=Rhabdaerophilum sp. TaxID=2717341 RepID=UPI0038D4250F